MVLVIVTLLAGFYPAWVLSKFSPVEAFKNKMSALSPEGISLRRILVVFQFVIAQVLIIGTLIIVNQMDYFMKMPLGFEKNAVLNMPIPTDSISYTKLDYLHDELSAVTGVKDVSFSSTPPTDSSNNWTDFLFDHAGQNTDFYAIIKGIDYNYLNTYNLQLVAGRDFRKSGKNTDFIVNEAVVKNLGFHDPNDVLNKEISLWEGQVTGTVVGVVRDFHERSFKVGIAPLLLLNTAEWHATAGIKFTPLKIPGILANLELIWDEIYPNQVFEYQFLDEKVAGYYEQERRIGNMYKIAAVIALILSCLGLYGLASFMILQRYKEAGIRKVLGASVHQLMYLFSREFLVLVGLAFCIAAPIAWYFMSRWLEGYEYHFQLNPWIFLFGGTLATLIAMGTVSYQSIKVAIANPVKSLRNE
jgi:ABC-type antimicrobial peptide transport system permease subunit